MLHEDFGKDGLNCLKNKRNSLKCNNLKMNDVSVMGIIFTLCCQVQPNSYYTFYDDQRQNWSLKFESEKASSDFCKEVSNTAWSFFTI